MYYIIFRLLLKLTKRDQQELEKKTQAVTLEMLQPSRYKPNDLEQMAEETKFSKSIFKETLESEHKKELNQLVLMLTKKTIFMVLLQLLQNSNFFSVLFKSVIRSVTTVG